MSLSLANKHCESLLVFYIIYNYLRKVSTFLINVTIF